MAVCGDSEMKFRVPLVVVIGATGAGKSKLAIDIAKKFQGEVISADSMQVYRGLDIITNKVTEEECQGVPHHLLDILEPSDRFTVVDFRNAALPIIDDLLSRNKMPVVVGGTNYYIESLLWKVLVATEHTGEAAAAKRRHFDDGSDSESEDTLTSALLKRIRGSGDPEELRNVPSEELHRELQKVDPESAIRLHPNDRRRVLRSLQVFKQLGRKHSDVLKEQRSAEGGSSLGGPLRYPHSLLLWTQCDQETLNARLDARVDQMMQRGLVAELQDFHRRYNEQRLQANQDVDYTEGIFQSIGFKEFHSWLVQPESARLSEEGQRQMRVCAEALKAATRRYSRRQLRWIRNRMLRRPDRQVPPLYGVDTSDVARWEELVSTPALATVDAHIRGVTPPQPPITLEPPLTNALISFHCLDCDRVFVGTIQWESHLKSKKHARQVKKKAVQQAPPAGGEPQTTGERPQALDIGLQNGSLGEDKNSVQNLPKEPSPSEEEEPLQADEIIEEMNQDLYSGSADIAKGKDIIEKSPKLATRGDTLQGHMITGEMTQHLDSGPESCGGYEDQNSSMKSNEQSTISAEANSPKAVEASEEMKQDMECLQQGGGQGDDGTCSGNLAAGQPDSEVQNNMNNNPTAAKRD